MWRLLRRHNPAVIMINLEICHLLFSEHFTVGMILQNIVLGTIASLSNRYQLANHERCLEPFRAEDSLDLCRCESVE